MEKQYTDNIDDLVKKVLEDKLRFSKIDEEVGNSNLGTLIRRLYLERKYGISLSAIGSTIIDFEELKGRNIENAIGAAQIPIGVAGPLRLNGEHAKGEYYVPLATTEGALVASVSRGCKAITQSGGAYSYVLSDHMTRAPLFKLPNIGKAVEFIDWVKKNFSEIKSAAEKKTRHGKLIDITPFIVGNNVWLRFRFKTGDAMGMNMVTIATDNACKYIVENYPDADLIALSGNMCTDKKPTYINTLLGRGKTVIAESIIKRDVVEQVLKTTVDEMINVNIRKNMLGTSYAGGIGANAHAANIVAAVFIATGQDVAQVVESSIAYTWFEKTEEGDLYASVTLPSLEVGTVGGGTRLPTQTEALNLLGVAGSGDPPGLNAIKLAEIIASTVLAGEINLIAAIASGHLARAHERLGRKGG